MSTSRRTAPNRSDDRFALQRWEMPDALLAGAQRQGHDIDAILEETKISRPSPASGVAIDVTTYVALIQLLTERLNDDALALFSRPIRPGSVVLLLRSALGAPTIEQALRRMTRTFSLLQEDYQPTVTRTEQNICLRLASTIAPAQRRGFADVIALRCFWRMTTWLAGGQVVAERFELPYEPSIEPAFSQAQYGGRAYYGSGDIALWFPASAMQQPVCRDEQAFKAFFSNAQGYLFGCPDEQKLGAQIRALLLRTQPAWLDLTQAAAMLNMSGSTVQRRLAAEGCCYQAVKDDLRREIAIARLTGSDIPIKTLADELGFHDAPSFQRAFKTWTGQPPGRYRARQPSHGRPSGAPQTS